MFVICPLLCLDYNRDIPASPPASVSISVSLLSVLGHFSATLSSTECVVSCILAPPTPPSIVSVFPPAPLSLFSLFYLSLYVSSCIPQLKLCMCLWGLYIPHSSAVFRTHLFFKKQSLLKNKSLSTSQPNLYLNTKS